MAKQKEGSDTFNVRIPDRLRNDMLKTCKALNKTPSWVIREALQRYLDRVEKENIDPYGIIKDGE